jgi:hypothetical protein
MILAAESPRIQKLSRNPGLKLVNFAAEADAYDTRFPSLDKIVLNEGAIEFNPILPPADVTLMATSAVMLIRKDLHPSLASILAHVILHHPKAGYDKEGDPILFYKPGRFPSINDPEYEASREAKLVYSTGELPYLLAKATPVIKGLDLPFGVAAFADAHGAQTALLLIPALTILYPIVHFVPQLYRWSVRRRLLAWYRQLKALETRLEHEQHLADIGAMRGEIEQIDRAVRRIRVPLFFTDQFYDLRGHIDFVRRRIETLDVPPLRTAAE